MAAPGPAPRVGMRDRGAGVGWVMALGGGVLGDLTGLAAASRWPFPDRAPRSMRASPPSTRTSR